MSTDLNWLVLAYTLPPEPSRTRVSIWRRLRKLGAVYLDEGVWVLPNSEQLIADTKAVLKEIHNFEGKGSAFVSHDIDSLQGDRLQARFIDARAEEYAELDGQCDRFMLHIEHATSTKRYTFAEVEELEEELSKLERWLREIRSRDFFNSPLADISATHVEKGRRALNEFTERAFKESNDTSRV